MYLNNLVVAIQLAGGKTLRESSIRTESIKCNDTTREGEVFLPFGTEYEIFLKNNSDHRAVIDVFIDGMNALGEHKLVLRPFQSETLTRFILDGNLNSGRKFKFVSKDSPEISNPGSSNLGWISVRCQWEKAPYYLYTTWPSMPQWNYWRPYTMSIPFYVPINPSRTDTPLPEQPYIGDPLPGQEPWTFCATGGVNKTRVMGATAMFCSTQGASLTNMSMSNSSPAESQKGGTVEGGMSYQSFSTTSVGELQEETTTIRFHLFAPKSEEPYTVQDTKKKYCHQCRLLLPGNAKYCPKCGIKQEYLV